MTRRHVTLLQPAVSLRRHVDFTEISAGPVVRQQHIRFHLLGFHFLNKSQGGHMRQSSPRRHKCSRTERWNYDVVIIFFDTARAQYMV